MAFSLKSILNDHSVSPTRPTGSEGDESQQGMPTPAQTAEKTSKFGTLPPSTPSPQFGALYNRRAIRSNGSSGETQHLQELATPPASSDPSCDYSRDTPSPPPHEFDFTGFNIFKALLTHPELVHEFSKQLDLESLISLYAISKDFHDLCNCRFATTALGHAKLRAPESVDVFRFRCYENLCQHDPAKRPNLDREGEVRDVPSFRWVRMVEQRETVVTAIIRLLAAEGHRLPRRASITIKKIWFTMDIGDNARRIGLIRNARFWTDLDLSLATMFFIKLDMRFTNPMDGDGETGLRKLLMAQRGLTVLHRVLKGEEIGNRFDLLRLYVETMFVPPPGLRGKEICGVPGKLVGSLCREGWGQGKKKLVQLHELVMSEAIRRGLGMEHRYMDFILWGHIDPKTFEDIHPLQLNEDDDVVEAEYRLKVEKIERMLEPECEEHGKERGGGNDAEDRQEDGKENGDGDGEWEDVEENEDSDAEADGQATNPGTSALPA
ncbi:hypothetical protein MMC30_007918 [Trapelia coarctata]|nr:hypothetical protein [Trapelia coarctata]